MFIGGAATFVSKGSLAVKRSFKTAIAFIGGAVIFIEVAVMFIGRGGSAVRRSFETAVAFIGRGSSAVGGRGEASRACADGACADRTAF